MSYQGSRTLLNRTNLSSIINTTSVGSAWDIASQYGNLFISIRIYNETEFGLQLLFVLNTTDPSRQVVFLLNNTLLLVSIQYKRHIDIYSVDLIAKTFQYNQSIYISFWQVVTPVFTLSYNGLSWMVSNLTATQTVSNGIPTQVDIDSCERLWVTVYSFCIRIYDTIEQTLLANWSIASTTVDTLLLLEN